ncbi:hypothetical protein RFI_02182, partial [Reticulomyxa filosa]
NWIEFEKRGKLADIVEQQFGLTRPANDINATKALEIALYKHKVPSDYFTYRSCLPRTAMDDHNSMDKHLSLVNLGELKSICEESTRIKINSKTKELIWIKNDTKPKNMEFQVEHMELILTPKLIKAFQKGQRHDISCAPVDINVNVNVSVNVNVNNKDQVQEPVDLQSCYPMLAFHCTDQANLKSICYWFFFVFKEGLKACGDVLEFNGQKIPMNHGNVWGDGVYVTPTLTLARYYGNQDCFKRGQVLVNLVNLKRVHRITAKEADKSTWKPKFFPCWWSSRQLNEHNELVYSCGAHTHIEPEGQQIIVANSSQILPLLLVTYACLFESKLTHVDMDLNKLGFRSYYSVAPKWHWLASQITGAFFFFFKHVIKMVNFTE